jgi:antitoxin MazE
MTIPLKKWGNSLAIRIPKDIANTLSIGYDTTMEMSVENGAIILKPKNNSRLKSLVSKINPHNIHNEIETGEVVGNEEW